MAVPLVTRLTNVIFYDRFVDRDMSMRYRGGGPGHLDPAQKACPLASTVNSSSEQGEPDKEYPLSREEFEALQMEEFLRGLVEEESEDEESQSESSDFEGPGSDEEEESMGGESEKDTPSEDGSEVSDSDSDDEGEMTSDGDDDSNDEA